MLDDRYQLEECIGRGGMGEVYRARHLRMAGRVAVKILRPDLAADSTASRRFLREAKSTFHLDHHHCVRVIDFGATDDGFLYLVMEYVDGRTVGAELEVDGALAPARVVHILTQLARALAHAHARGLVHRDLKPDNIMLLHRDGDPDFVKVLDFGLAKMVDTSRAFTATLSVTPLTARGVVFGTPIYMSPEQAMDQPLDARSDLYSVGVLAYEMLVGQPPFEGFGFMDVLRQHVQAAPTPPSQRRPGLPIPPQLEALVMACLAKAPTQRPANAATLADALGCIATSDEALPVSRLSAAATGSRTLELATEALVMRGGARESQGQPHSRGGVLVMPEACRPSRLRRGWTIAAAAGLTVIAALLTAHLAGEPRHALAPGIERGVADAMRSRSGSPSGPSDGRDLAAHADAVASDEPSSGPLGARAAPGPSAAAPPPKQPRSAQQPPAKRPPRQQASTRRGSPDTAPAAPAPARRDDAATARETRRRDHLQAAEAARRAGNTLKQMAEADGALRLAPRDSKAAYLLGDALITSGDSGTGCSYLARAQELPQARARWQASGCRSGN